MGRCPNCGGPLASGSRFCPSCGARQQDHPNGGEVRKTVTVLFADISGSTELGERLDPESLRRLLSRHFSSARSVLELHGGTVEKFIGDAVMAVFGIPIIHEDDALRAVRAALALQAGVTSINDDTAATASVRVRVGVNTGEVVTGGAGSETLVTGDTVNIAARLEQAADAGEILIGSSTYELVRDAVSAEPAHAMSLRGKALPVDAYRLISAMGGDEGHRRNANASMVGRSQELAALMDAWTATRHREGAELVTVVAAAGVGKSRLVRELANRLKAETTIARGRCLPYGDGITYWAIREAVQDLAGIEAGDSIEAARRRVSDLLPISSPPEVADGVAAAIGLEEHSLRQEELFWAVRRCLEAVAERAPLLLLIEDLHWAEDSILDLLEYIVEMATSPMLIVGTARPELLATRVAWGGTRSSWLLRLEPMGTDAAAELLAAQPGGGAITPDYRRRILDVADGNPLFIEEMVGMLRGRGLLQEPNGEPRLGGEPTRLDVPPTIQALLAARLDQLPADERAVAQRGAVVGRSFEGAALVEMGPDDLPRDLARPLLGLVRKELLRPERSELSDGDAFRFRHILIRDAAYRSLPKTDRATLHESFARWLERVAKDRVTEYEEIIGFHLQQAAAYRGELGDPRASESRMRAAPWFLKAGRRAGLRDDLHAAESLLRTAADLAAGSDPITETAALTILAEHLLDAARLKESGALSSRAIQVATRSGDHRAAAHARIFQAHLHHHTQPATWVEEAHEVVADAIKVFTATGDELGLARAWRLLGVADQNDPTGSAEAIRQSLLHAEQSGDVRELGFAMIIEAHRLVVGPESVPDALPRGRALLDTARAIGRGVTADIAITNAVLEAMAGYAESARVHSAEGLQIQRELGLSMDFAFGVMGAASIHFYLDELEVSEAYLREGLDRISTSGDEGISAYLAGRLAWVLTLQDRYDEAVGYIALARATISANEMDEASWRAAQARVDAAAGKAEAALGHAHRALALVNPGFPTRYAVALMDLAVVLKAAGRIDEARDALGEARATAEHKGNISVVRLVDRELSALG